MFTAPKDEVAIILFGTEGNSNCYIFKPRKSRCYGISINNKLISYVNYYQSILETENDLADGFDGYKNITVVRQFGIPDQELLQYVHDGIIPGRLIASSPRVLAFTFNKQTFSERGAGKVYRGAPSLGISQSGAFNFILS